MLPPRSVGTLVQLARFASGSALTWPQSHFSSGSAVWHTTQSGRAAAASITVQLARHSSMQLP